MRHLVRNCLAIALSLLGMHAAVATAAAAAPTSQYTMTVNKDRLQNALNEPQNWLLMNGDYGGMRYSKLTQINRDSVKNLRMVWALALGGMQDVGQNGPESELNPLIDNGFMYTSDGWGTVYKIDARNPNKGEFVWASDSGVQHEGLAPLTRGIALWNELVLANLPDGRVIGINRDPQDEPVLRSGRIDRHVSGYRILRIADPREILGRDDIVLLVERRERTADGLGRDTVRTGKDLVTTASLDLPHKITRVDERIVLGPEVEDRRTRT